MPRVSGRLYVQTHPAGRRGFGIMPAPSRHTRRRFCATRMPAMNPLVECVPNFSEARRPEVIQAIVAALEQGGGASIRVLDVSSDLDHNRTVVTLVGTPAGVEAALFAGIARAAELINLDQHRGE